MKHHAIYLRVSSKTQDAKSQEPDLEKWAKMQELPVIFYKDKFTGKSMDRPGWNRLTKAMDAGDVVSIVCWRLDRLGRTASGLTKLFEELVQKKVNLVSLKDGIDLSTAAGRMLANILASLAQWELELRKERVLAGQEKARAEGKRWGGSVKGRRTKVTDEQLVVIQRMESENAKVTAIARATGLSRQTVYQYLAA